MRALLHTFIILICMCLTACGFHLRGSVNLPASLQRIYIESGDPYGELVRNIKEYLKASNVYIADSPLDANMILQITHESETNQLLSVGGTQQTRQYNLILTVTFQLKKPNGSVVLPPQTISDTRPITIEANQILGGSNEANNLYAQMRRSIVYLLMMRLAAHGTAHQIMQAEYPNFVLRRGI